MNRYEGPAAVSAAGIWIDRNVGEDWLLVDLRSAEEYAACHVPGSMHVPWPELHAYELRVRIAAGDRGVAYIAPCDIEGDEVERALACIGLPGAHPLERGIAGWAALGFPLVASSPLAPEEARGPRFANGLMVSGLLMAAFVAPEFLMVSGLGWFVRGLQQRADAEPRQLVPS